MWGSGSGSAAQFRDGEDGRGVAIFQLELGQDARDVILHRAKSEAEQDGDLAVQLALGHPIQHLALPRRKAQILQFSPTLKFAAVGPRVLVTLPGQAQMRAEGFEQRAILHGKVRRAAAQ